MILAMRPEADHPQVVSTSRHVTQGMVDLLEEKWDPATKTLSGRSKLVAGDPYEIRIALGAKWHLADFVGPSFSEKDGLARFRTHSPDGGECAWLIKFAD